MNRRAKILFGLAGVCCLTLVLYYYEVRKLFEDVPKIFEPKPRNQTTVDDILILVFSGKLVSGVRSY